MAGWPNGRMADHHRQEYNKGRFNQSLKSQYGMLPPIAAELIVDAHMGKETGVDETRSHDRLDKSFLRWSKIKETIEPYLIIINS